MSGHTPGPWKWVRARTMYHLHGPAGYFGVSIRANSRAAEVRGLIAAAPRLLALAQKYASECAECEGRGYVLTYADPYERGDVSSPERTLCVDCADIHAAIAAATGEQA